MRTYLILFIPILLVACGQHKKTDAPKLSEHLTRKQIHAINDSLMISYIHHPKSIDTTCIKEIHKAEQDAKDGKVYFCLFSMDASDLKHEDELSRLCIKHGIKFKYIAPYCLTSENQTAPGVCYKAFMDSILAKGFGKDFKDKLIEQSEKMEIPLTDTVDVDDCDGESEEYRHFDTSLVIHISKDFKSKLKLDYEENKLTELIYFYVDTSGIASGYHSIPQNFDGSDDNKKYADQLLKMCIQSLQKRKKWQVGKVNKHKFTTEHNAEIIFK